MKNLVIIALLGMLTVASAQWKCYSSSVDGWGLGYSMNKQYAIDISINECRKTTAAWNFCYVRSCTWI